MARPWVPAGARVLDVGCSGGEFLRSLGDRIGPSVGVDPRAEPSEGPRYRVVASPFREPMPWPAESFDAVVLLATLDHITDKDPLARECRRLLRPGGRVVVTVPSRLVDPIVGVLRALRLADGMTPGERHGFDPAATPELFARHGFAVEHARRFQLGLNHLYVLVKPWAVATGPAGGRPSGARLHRPAPGLA